MNGRLENTGTYPIWGAGLVVENFDKATGYWHVNYDPTTNSTYFPLRSGLLQPQGSQNFGFIIPLESGCKY